MISLQGCEASAKWATTARGPAFTEEVHALTRIVLEELNKPGKVDLRVFTSSDTKEGVIFCIGKHTSLDLVD